MSLDGGYIGSIDHAIANLHIGRRQGHQQGLEEGYQQGLKKGYQQGFEEGRLSGWNQATEEGNERMRQQLAYTHQHFTEKERIKAEHQRLQEQVADLDAKYQEECRQHTALVREYNCIFVLMNSLSMVLEDLTGEDMPKAECVRKLFAERYTERVSNAFKAGYVSGSLENEPEFAKSLPQVRQFILNMLPVGRKN